MSTLVIVLIVVFAVLLGIALGVTIDYLGPVKKEKKEEAKRRSEVLRKAWSFLSNYFYEPLVYEMAKEVSETGDTSGVNVRRWSQFFIFLKDLGFFEIKEVVSSMEIIHSAKAHKWMIEIKWYSYNGIPYIEPKQWSILYLDENKGQIARLVSRCRRDALAEFPLHQLLKAKEIQIHDPDGNLTDSLDVHEEADEILLVRSEKWR